MRIRREFSAGGVVVRREGEEVLVALAARRTRRGDLAWGLPKGLVEEGEEPPQAAIREVEEETGLVATVQEPLGEISYWYVWEGERVRKRVSFFLMEAVGGDVSRHDQEMEDVRWFPLAEADRVAAFPSERGILGRARASLGMDS